MFGEYIHLDSVLGAFVGFLSGVGTILTLGAWLLRFVLDSYTAKLVEKFDERYPSREVFLTQVKRVGALEERVVYLERQT